jgi:hypothetical protein
MTFEEQKMTRYHAIGSSEDGICFLNFIPRPPAPIIVALWGFSSPLHLSSRHVLGVHLNRQKLRVASELSALGCVSHTDFIAGSWPIVRDEVASRH